MSDQPKTIIIQKRQACPHCFLTLETDRTVGNNSASSEFVRCKSCGAIYHRDCQTAAGRCLNRLDNHNHCDDTDFEPVTLVATPPSLKLRKRNATHFKGLNAENNDFVSVPETTSTSKQPARQLSSITDRNYRRTFWWLRLVGSVLGALSVVWGAYNQFNYPFINMDEISLALFSIITTVAIFTLYQSIELWRDASNLFQRFILPFLIGSIGIYVVRSLFGPVVIGGWRELDLLIEVFISVPANDNFRYILSVLTVSGAVVSLSYFDDLRVRMFGASIFILAVSFIGNISFYTPFFAIGVGILPLVPDFIFGKTREEENKQKMKTEIRIETNQKAVLYRAVALTLLYFVGITIIEQAAPGSIFCEDYNFFTDECRSYWIEPLNFYLLTGSVMFLTSYLYSILIIQPILNNRSVESFWTIAFRSAFLGIFIGGMNGIGNWFLISSESIINSDDFLPFLIFFVMSGLFAGLIFAISTASGETRIGRVFKGTVLIIVFSFLVLSTLQLSLILAISASTNDIQILDLASSSIAFGIFSLVYTIPMWIADWLAN